MGSSASKQVNPGASIVTNSIVNGEPPANDIKDENEKAMEDHQTYLENMYTLKRMFKELDPAVMKTTRDVQGELKVSVKHITDKSLLLVKVIAAQDLLAKDARGHTSDPYVKVELLLNNKPETLSGDDSSAKCTSVAKNTRNPVFNEIFTYSMTAEQTNFAKLRCSVWCYDGLGRDDFMGERIISVGDLDCHDVINTGWYELLPEIDLSIGGEVSIKLTYKLPQTLNVTVVGANNVNLHGNDVEPYVRVYIPGVPYVYKTASNKDRSAEMTWNESFDFPLPKEEFSSRYIVLIMGDGNDSDSYLGECHIDLENFQFEHGFEGSFPLSDMRGSVTVRSRWTRNAMTQEFDEALHAHAMYKQPQFMFARVRGASNAAVTVRVPKAGAQSRLRVVNGVLVH